MGQVTSRRRRKQLVGWVMTVVAAVVAGIGVNIHASRSSRAAAIARAQSLLDAADTLSEHGNYRDARAVYQQVVELLVDKNVPAGVAEGLNGMGICDLNLGTPQEVPNEALQE